MDYTRESLHPTNEPLVDNPHNSIFPNGKQSNRVVESSLSFADANQLLRLIAEGHDPNNLNSMIEESNKAA